MADEQLNRLQAFLAKHDSSLDTLPKVRVKQLEMADEAILMRIAATESAHAALKINAINVSTISADTSISRKTFYNNDLLRLYVETYSSAESESNISSNEIDRLKAKNIELTRQVRDFVLRDVTTENLRHENLKLTHEIKNRDAQIDYLQKQYEKSQAELLQIKKTLASLPGHVIPFPKKNPSGQTDPNK